MDKQTVTLLCLVFLMGMAIQFAFDMAFVIRPVFEDAFNAGYNASLYKNNASRPWLSDNCKYNISDMVIIGPGGS